MPQPGIPNELVLSTACFGPRLRTIEDQAFSAVAMGFRSLELGLSATPPDLSGWEDATRETGVTLACMVVGALKPLAPDMSGSKLGSLDAEAREMALSSTRRHVKVAQQLGAPWVIVRGCSAEDPKAAEEARTLVAELASVDPDDVEEYNERVRTFVHGVQKKGQKQVEHFCRSLHTLCQEFPETRFSVQPGLRLSDLFGFEAMQWVLDDLASQKVEYWHDTGRIHQREIVGLPGQGDWLDAFSSRMAGMHLADATHAERGLPPSQGEVDFKLVSEYATQDMARVVDVHPSHGRAEVLGSVQFLVGLGL